MPKSLKGRNHANHWLKMKGKICQHQKARMPKSKKKNATPDAGGPSAATDMCLYCREADDITKWVQCQKCEMWAHYECAGIDDTFFNWLCEFCE